MFFRQFLHEEKSCCSYFIGCVSKAEALVVDAQGDPAQYLAMAGKHGMKVVAVVETHVQADHISASRELAARAGARLFFGKGAAVQFSFDCLSDGQILAVGNRRVRIIATPGHTADHVCLLVDDWFVLTGDTLFVGDVGRVDLSLAGASSEEVAGRARMLYASIQKLLALPEWTEVYPGHYSGSVCGRGMDGKPLSTIGREKRKNKPLQLSEEDFIRYQMANLPALPEDFHEIKMQNLGTG